jgi:hypothetical protein
MLPKLIEAGIQLVISLITGLVEAIPKIVKMLPQIVEAIWNGLANVDWLDLGTQIVQGIIDGLASMGKALLDAIVDLAESAFEGFKDFFGIASPARRMKQPGRDVVRGAVAGVEDEAPAFGDALVSMADSASAKAQAAMRQVSADVSVGVTPSTGVGASSSSSSQDRLRPISVDGVGVIAWLREFVDGRAEIVLDESVLSARTAARGK